MSYICLTFFRIIREGGEFSKCSISVLYRQFSYHSSDIVITQLCFKSEFYFYCEILSSCVFILKRAEVNSQLGVEKRQKSKIIFAINL